MYVCVCVRRTVCVCVRSVQSVAYYGDYYQSRPASPPMVQDQSASPEPGQEQEQQHIPTHQGPFRIFEASSPPPLLQKFKEK